MSSDLSPDETPRLQSAFSHDIREYEKSVREFVSTGQLMTAIEVARDGLARFGGSLILRQQLALALAQTGALDAAQEVLGQLLDRAGDEETLSLLGRVYKELWRRANTPAEASAALKRACDYYGRAFAIHESYYPGINLAFSLAALGERDRAEATARKVAKQCRTAIANAGADADGWLLATLGEALIHQGYTEEAGKYYGQAAEKFRGRWRDLASMRKQAREVLKFHEDAPVEKVRWNDLAALRRKAREIFRPTEKTHDWLDRWFDFPSVVTFCGHMIDAPGRASPRFPPGREAEVREAIKQKLHELRAGFGYSSAACGGDILFCECLLEMGASVNLVLPCPVDAFKLQSVSFAGADWERRFHRVLGNASTLLIANASGHAASPADPASATALIYANRVITGLAVLQAQALDVELNAVALWDGKPGDGAGGTSSVIAEWQRRNITPLLIPLGADVALPATPPEPPAAPAPSSASVVSQTIMAIVYAEVTQFKQINEQQIPAYVREFRAVMAGVLAELPRAPEMNESIGGAHYFAFEDLEEAGLFALELRDRVMQTKWADRGLPAELALRVVLHAGPVFAFDDPVLGGRRNCLGAHVARTARIAPVTPAGQVYVTQEFAALCGAGGISGVAFEFLGHLPTTMLFQEAPLYRLDRGRLRTT
ncbi:MAG TPA: TRAFs-binding domain-containing protein [Opitutus sp.]|nr:TRAFs-binding domain-containing protein [Opitutus sp.]